MTPPNNSADQHRLPLGTAALMPGVGLLLMVLSAPFAQLFTPRPDPNYISSILSCSRPVLPPVEVGTVNSGTQRSGPPQPSRRARRRHHIEPFPPDDVQTPLADEDA